MPNKSVAIIGAGTAGLILAKRLAKAGIDTTIYDQKGRPGFPVRASGILSITGLSTLGIEYEDAITNTLHGAVLNFGKKSVRIRAKKPIAHILDRLKLNEICMKEAVSAGAKVRTNTRIEPEKLDDLAANNIIVGADGAVSIVASHFKFPPITRHVLTYRTEHAYAREEQDMVELFFDNNMAKGFFGWLSPNSSDVTELGIGVLSGKDNSKACFGRFIEKPEIKGVAAARILDSGASMIPTELRKRFVHEKDEVLLVGDAAGQVKPTTGGGIIFGGNGAVVAANTIINYTKGNARLRDYEKKWRSEFGKEVRMHNIIYSLYSKMNTKGMEIIASAMNKTRFNEFLSEYGDMDRPSIILRRLFLRPFSRS